MDVRGENMFITGNTRGIGKAMALAFASTGASIILNRRGEIPKEKIEEIETFGVRCVEVSGDTFNYGRVGQMIKEAEEKLGSIHILVDNIGITSDKLVMRMDTKDFRKCFDINLTGTLNITQHVLKKMMKQREGATINLSSVSRLVGNIGQANYATNKAGVVGLTKSVARGAATRGVTYNATALEFIATNITEVLTDKVKERAEKQIPMQRFGRIEDVAQTAVFLAQNPHIVGQVINVDGGLAIHG